MATSLEAATGGAVAVNAGRNARQFQALFEVIPFTFTFEEDSLAVLATATRDITVTGAALGDFVLLSSPIDNVNGHLWGFVQSANTVTVMLSNADISGGDACTAFATAVTCNGLILKPRTTWARN